MSLAGRRIDNIGWATLFFLLIGFAVSVLVWILRGRTKADARRHASGLAKELEEAQRVIEQKVLALTKKNKELAERKRSTEAAAQQLRNWGAKPGVSGGTSQTTADADTAVAEREMPVVEDEARLADEQSRLEAQQAMAIENDTAAKRWPAEQEGVTSQQSPTAGEIAMASPTAAEDAFAGREKALVEAEGRLAEKRARLEALDAALKEKETVVQCWLTELAERKAQLAEQEVQGVGGPAPEPEPEPDDNDLQQVLRKGAEQQRHIMAILDRMRAQLEEAQSAAKVAGDRATRAELLAAQHTNEFAAVTKNLEQLTKQRDELAHELVTIRSRLRSFTDSLLGVSGESALGHAAGGS
jgi:hypothetical protein